MSICSASANLRAPPEGRTWKPMMIASDAEANKTSDSEIWPTAFDMMLTWICSVESFNNEVKLIESDILDVVEYFFDEVEKVS